MSRPWRARPSRAPRPRTRSPRARARLRDEWPTEPSWDDRVSDRANPVLVRDVVQVANTKLMTAAVVIASLVILKIGMSMLPTVDALASPDPGHGLHSFAELWAAVIAIVWGLVPFLAFLSMREDVAGSTAEHLFLSGLTPTRIVGGKVGGGLLFALVFVSLAAPLFALGYALRGVSLPTLCWSFVFVLLGATALCTVAVALACASRHLRPAALTVGLAAALFGGLAWLAVDRVRLLLGWLEYAAMTGEATAVALALAVLVFVTATAWLCSTASLSHRHENHSTGFRTVGLAAVAVGAAIVWASVARPQLGRAAPTFALAAAVLLTPFWAGAATEKRGLSPRERTAVGDGGARGLLLAPLLPGRGSGLLWVLALVLSIEAVAIGVPAVLGRAATPTLSAGLEVTDLVHLAVLYVLLYAGLGAAVRALLDRRGDPRAPWLSRVVLPLVALGSWVVPLIVNGIRGLRSVEWNLAHFLNPVTTGLQVAREGLRPDLVVLLGALAALLWSFSVPTIAATLAECWRGPGSRSAHGSGSGSGRTDADDRDRDPDPEPAELTT